MKKLSIYSIFVSIAGFISAPLTFGHSTSLQERMLQDLDFIKGVFQTQYAPVSWKKQFSQWDLDQEIERAKEQVLKEDTLPVKSYQKILKNFFSSTQDYHVGIQFYSTESAFLPFSVKGSHQKYYLTYINREKLPDTSFPFQVGDELVLFGDRPTHNVITELQQLNSPNTLETDQAIAEMTLTRRQGQRGIAVPQGPVTLGIRPNGVEKVYTYQLIWEYQPEQIQAEQIQPPQVQPLVQDDPPASSELTQQTLFHASSKKSAKDRIYALNHKMLTPLLDYFSNSQAEENPFLLGTRKSYIPELGQKIWETADSEDFHAYIYQNQANRLMGYIRIPTYFPEDADFERRAKNFQQMVQKLQVTTDALVIDQINNPGGSVFYLYALASMLADQALYTPLHQMTITQADVAEAVSLLEELTKIKTDEEARKLLGETLQGYPVSYSFVQFGVNFCRFLINEWNAGRTLTHPYYLWGVDRINPSQNRYTKPILLVINELDFSGGDFFPAILQDNQRVKIFGTRTAGAGGYVLSVNYPNLFGIAGFSVTGSFAKRMDQNPIENLGVKPDIQYTLTEKDFQQNYSGYVKALQEAADSLIK